ncbi:DUF1819 family protein [Bifidobacterium jacchi]|uniref:DUF1819 family protein n=1 Tax=Bifidobacterium jacchi TaxID=2490545 RepID=A0A5N5RJV4_9BIFI|nr:DUF1819 family protein [Bifidobacterium jacchi]KAB5607453.1 DUF1819 family protein [Bifidobacterium jacchi]
MAGSYGAETGRNERYRLSFTVGGLLAPQGRVLASMLVRDAAFVADTAPAAGAESAADPMRVELGERVLRIRRRAIDSNALSIRTQSASARMVSEVLKRLSALSGEEIRFLADEGTTANDCRALMWVAMCRYYALIGQFAAEVVRDRYLMGLLSLTREDYDRFIRAKAMWHPELEELTPATANKLRANLFKAMVEADLLDARDNTILPSLLSGTVLSMLDGRPDSMLFFPMRNA